MSQYIIGLDLVVAYHRAIAVNNCFVKAGIAVHRTPSHTGVSHAGIVWTELHLAG